MAVNVELPKNTTGSAGGGRHRPVPHIATLPNEAISFLTPYSGLLLTLWLVVLFLIKRYILEIVFPRTYKRTYTSMNDGLRRGFLVHHVSAGTKIVLLIVGAKPFCDVVFGKSTLHDPLSRLHTRPTYGDILLVLTQLFVALYVFELLIRKSPSPIAVLHHAGAIIIAQSAVVLSLRLEKEQNATMEFVLCLVWAAFDVLAELWLNVAFILYRIYPHNYNLMAYVFGSTCIISVMGTIAETVMIMTLFGQSWQKWDLSFKVVTPILHVLFTIAQLHAARILLAMWIKQKEALADEDAQLMDLEIGGSKKKRLAPSTVVAVSGDQVVEDAPACGVSNEGMREPQVSQQQGQQDHMVHNTEGSIEDRNTQLHPEAQRTSREKHSLLLHINRFFTGR